MIRVKVGLVALLTLLLVAIPSVADAKFTRAASAALPVSTDTLNSPTGLGFTCFGSGGRITITWTITTDTYATGYTITGSYGGTSQSVTVPGRTTSAVTPTQSVPLGTTGVMVSTYRNWKSVQSNTLLVNKTCP